MQDFIENKDGIWFVQDSIDWGADQKMNVSKLEKMSVMKSIPREGESRVEQWAYCIEYLNQPFYNSMRDMIMTQITSCEGLLINTERKDERNVILRETLILKLILELLEYWSKLE